MSPTNVVKLICKVCFPRVSGDEPARRATPGAYAEFSPRERG